MITPHKKLTLLLIIFCLTTLTLTQQWYQRGNPHFINQADYQRLVINPQTRNKGVTMLKFFTPWCRYCKYLKDIIDELKARDTFAITIYEVNCDEDNHQFCRDMGVHSFPKMKVYENGDLMDNMDGFYPYQVVRELFLKYNRTQHVPEPLPVVQQVRHEQAHQQEHKQQKHEQVNYVEPQVVAPEGGNHEIKQHQEVEHEQTENKQPKHEEKQVQVPLNHAQQANPQQANPKQVQHHNTQQRKSLQPPKQQRPVSTKPAKHVQQKKVQPTLKKQQQPHNQQKNQSPTPQSSDNNIKKTQQMIQQQQNIAIVDQNIKQTQKQKKIVQQLQATSTIDLTKILPKQQHLQYGKYIIYALCIFVGGYYFVNIMKVQPVNESAKPLVNNKTKMSDRTINSQIPSRVSIEDSQLREELHFEHPNEEEMNSNSMEVRDEDL